MDAETLKLAFELADKVTTFAIFVCWVTWLIKENSILKSLLFGDWKRQREKEIEDDLKAKMKKELGSGQGI
jgi:hypothetical protein